MARMPSCMPSSHPGLSPSLRLSLRLCLRLRLCLCLRLSLHHLLRLSLSLHLSLRLSLRIDHLREHWMRERLVRVREHEAAMATMCGSATPVAEAAAALLRGLDHNLAERREAARALFWWPLPT